MQTYFDDLEQLVLARSPLIMSPKGHISTLFCDDSGSASVEAVVILPFFLLVFLAVSATHARYEAKQVALATARNCAWRYSDQGCKGAPPSGCSTKPSQPRAISSEQYPDLGFSPEHQKDDRLSKAISSKLEKSQRSLLGSYINAVSRASTPKFLDWEKLDVSAKYHLACNLEPQRLKDLLGFFWEAVK